MASNPRGSQTNEKSSHKGSFFVGEPGGIRTHDLLIRSVTIEGCQTLMTQGVGDSLKAPDYRLTTVDYISLSVAMAAMS